VTTKKSKAVAKKPKGYY